MYQLSWDRNSIKPNLTTHLLHSQCKRECNLKNRSSLFDSYMDWHVTDLERQL